MSELVDKIEQTERLEDKLSLIIYLQNFLRAGDDVDGNKFVNSRGVMISKNSAEDLFKDLERIEDEFMDKLHELYG